MARIKRIPPTTCFRGGYSFCCPGCGYWHTLEDGRFAFNGDLDRPSFSPSYSFTLNQPESLGYEPMEPTIHCHLQVHEGRVRFFTDSSHSLWGRDADLPEIT